MQDTTNNYRAQWDLHQLAQYNNICKAIGLNRLYDGADSLEVRVWRQFSYFGLSVDEEIYSLKLVDTTVYLTFYWVYCKPYDCGNINYKKWDPFTDPKIDSFVAVSKRGYTDGAVTSIELASNVKYKLIRYHEALSYYQDTKINEIKNYLDEYDRLIALFQSNKVYLL